MKPAGGTPGAIPRSSMGVRGSIAVLGATSGIARAAMEAWMSAGREVILMGRSLPALEALARDLEVAAGRRPPVFAWDIADMSGHGGRFAELAAAHDLGGLFLAAGVMFPQDEGERDAAKTVETFTVNLTGPAVVLNLFAAHFKAKGGGFLCCLSSVAGDRGRASNFIYGASKAGLSAYLEGLRGSLHGTGVKVVTVKPGPIRTRMTAGMGGLLVASPRTAGRDIVRAVERGRDVVYTPSYWRLIMWVICAIPPSLFKRLKL